MVAKEVVAAHYDRAASYSYFNGCSTGGRQGYAEAQKYPADYDGILANAPAVNWDEFEVATLWPQVVMNEAGTFPTACEFKAFTDAAVQACDRLDGAADGLLTDPDACGFDPQPADRHHRRVRRRAADDHRRRRGGGAPDLGRPAHRLGHEAVVGRADRRRPGRPHAAARSTRPPESGSARRSRYRPPGCRPG